MQTSELQRGVATRILRAVACFLALAVSDEQCGHYDGQDDQKCISHVGAPLVGGLGGSSVNDGFQL